MEGNVETYGNAEILYDEENLLNIPIKLEYYKTYSNKGEKYNKPYGIGVTKTIKNEIESNVEKREFSNIFSKENEADNMLELLLKNKVTPIELKDILEDFVLV